MAQVMKGDGGGEKLTADVFTACRKLVGLAGPDMFRFDFNDLATTINPSSFLFSFFFRILPFFVTHVTFGVTGLLSCPLFLLAFLGVLSTLHYTAISHLLLFHSKGEVLLAAHSPYAPLDKGLCCE